MFHIFLTVFQVMRKEKVLSIAGRQDGNLNRMASIGIMHIIKQH